MAWLEISVGVTVGYLLGSISFPGIAIRLFASDEQKTLIQHPSTLSEGESYEPMYGAYSTNRIWGPRVGIGISLLDMLKVALPMWIFKVYLFPTEYYYLLVSVAGVFGHNWPVFFKFKGGRGAAVTIGSLFVIDWLGPIAVIPLGTIFGLLVLRDAGLTYLGFTVMMFPWLWFRFFDPILLLWVLGVDIALYLSIVPDIKSVRRIEEEKGVEEADEAVNKLTPGTREMRRFVDRIDALGKWKYVISLLGLLILVVVFWYLPQLPF